MANTLDAREQPRSVHDACFTTGDSGAGTPFLKNAFLNGGWWPPAAAITGAAGANDARE